MLKRIPLLLAAICLWAGLAAPAMAAPNVTVNARVSNEGRVRDSSWVTVTVDLVNQGAELQGEVVVEGTDGPFGHLPSYTVPVTLPAGARKQVPVDVPYRFGGLKLRFVSDGVTLHEGALSLTSVPPEALMIGVLSEDELGLPALAQIGQETMTGAAQVSRLSAETFPDQAALLRGLDVIAISRFDTGTLRPEQLSALEIWVSRGGTLLVTGGPEWKRTLAALPESLVPVAVTGVGDASLAPLGELVSQPLNATAPVSLGSLRRGRAAVSDGDIPLLVQDQLGRGRIFYLAADPGLAPLFGWSGQVALFDRYLSVTGRDQKFVYDDGDAQFMSLLQQIPGFGLPSLWLVVGLLAGYLLLIGPVNYLALKRLDRREWSWATIPVLSLLFVGGLYLAGVGTRTTMLSHRITVTELAPETGAASFRAYLGVFAPNRERLSFALTEPGLVMALPAFSSGPDEERPIRITLGEKTTVALEGLNSYSMRGILQERDVALDGTLRLVDVVLDEQGRLTARAENGLGVPLADVRVNVAGEEQRLGDLAPGERSQPFTTDLIALGNGRGPISQWADDETYYRNQLAEAAYYSHGNPYQADGTITLLGFTAEPLFPVEQLDLGRPVEGNNAVYVRLPLPYDPAGGELPPGMILGRLTAGGDWGESVDGYYELVNGTYSFELDVPPLDPARVAEVTLHIRQEAGEPLRLRAKNPETGEWEELSATEAQPLPGWAERIGAGGLLELQVNTTGRALIAPPTISAKGVDR